MREYVVVTDSTCDLPNSLVEELGIVVIPLGFSVDNRSYLHYPDEREMSIKEFYRLLREEKTSTTSQIPPDRFIEVFQSILSEGKDIIYFCFSSALSGTYNSARLAEDELMGQYPHQHIITVDTKAASMGEGLFVYHAALKKRQGCSLIELKEWAENARDSFCHWFTVDDLHHLKRGGRISATTEVIGTLLSVKPILHVDVDGRLNAVERVRGRRRSLNRLMEHMQNTYVDAQRQTVFIGHGDCIEDARYLEEAIRSKMDVGDIVIGFTGPIIGSHTGAGMVGLFYQGSHK
ncbi:MAG: DegV family protein [Saccharofermentanales bacterium]|jgi:DegV family protein with EDD domain